MKSYFGTDGIRGPVATSPYLTPSFLHRFGVALSSWNQAASGAASVIVLGSDTRASSKTIERALAAGITAAGGICVSAGIVSTPALQHIISAPDSQYDYGIMISASHNKATDNGIKVLTPTGKLAPAQEEMLSTLLTTTPDLPTCHIQTFLEPLPSHHAISYLSRMSTFFPSHLLTGLTIALDCAHGALSTIAPTMFASCGAQVEVMGAEPNGHNINEQCGSTAPARLQKLVAHTGADFGFAFDGDGDRVTMITGDGTIHSGESLLALISTHPRFATQPGVVGTVLSNLGLEQWLDRQGKTLLRTPVGDAHVLRAMVTNNLLLGGEPSGHLILRSYMPTADGLFTALFAAHTARITNNFTANTFTPHPQVVVNIPISRRQDLTLDPYARMLQAHHAAVAHGRSIIRYSGTEPVLRIMVEHPDASSAAHYAHELAQKLTPLLND